MEDIKKMMEDRVKREAERSLNEKKGKLDDSCNKIKNEVKSRYDQVIRDFSSKISS